MIIISYICTFAIVVLINLIITNICKKILKNEDNKLLSLLGCLLSCLPLLIILTIGNDGIMSPEFAIYLFFIETPLYIVNYFYLKKSKNSLKLLLLLLLLFFSTMVIMIISWSLSQQIECPSGFEYYKDNKCIQILDTEPNKKDCGYYDAELSQFIKTHCDCPSDNYGYSETDGMCYKVVVVDPIN